MERAAGAPERATLVAAALGGLLAGFALAKLRAPDLLAHLGAFAIGLLVVLGLAMLRIDPLVGGWHERVRVQWELLLEWYRRLLSGQSLGDPRLFSAVIALTLWLVAYTSGWVLYRRGWLTTALVVPGIIAVVNLGYAPAGALPLVVFVVAACLLAARHHLYRREVEWSRARMARPHRLPWHFLSAGANIALLVAVLTWSLPLGARELIASAAWQRLEEPWAAAVERWQEVAGDLPGPRRANPGSYAAFDDAFRLGGELRLSNDPVAVLKPVDGDRPQPAYLAGRRYNVYDGRGWSSDARETFSPEAGNGGPFSPEMRFAAGLGVHLSPTARPSRVLGEITTLRPKGDLLLTLGTFLTADRRFNVELSWQDVTDQPYDLTGDDVNAVLRRVPVDLRGLASLLVQANFPPAQAPDQAPMPTDAQLADRVAALQEDLRGRFLETTWTVGADGRVDSLVVSGLLPVYDDVEAVTSDAPVEEGSVYVVTGLGTNATPDQLRAAGTDYPDWVRDRYLGLPETITPRTRQLAAELAAGQPSRFDTARAIEGYVRDAIAYREDIEAPPRGQDVVDYVLFDSKQGYCEYYASAMAVLLRLNDIPARVVGGYFAVPYDAEVDGFLYRERNAHLWVEAYFPGHGWIPFEPTASQGRLTYGADQAPTPVATPSPAAESTPVPGSTPPVGDDTAGGTGPTTPAGGASTTLGWWALGGAVLLAVGALALLAAWSWGLRGLSPAGGLYARALRAGRWLGLRPSPATTPREYADQLGRSVPAAARPARVVSDYYARESFGGRPAEPGAAADAWRAWGELRRALARAGLRRRLTPGRGRSGRDERAR